MSLRLADYDELTRNIDKRLPAGSSAGGEQPKFTSTVPVDGNPLHDAHCIVKFTPPRGTPFGERWHDLLQLEHLANEVLRLPTHLSVLQRWVAALERAMEASRL